MDGLVQLDLELCKACGVCIELCPDKVSTATARLPGC